MSMLPRLALVLSLGATFVSTSGCVTPQKAIAVTPLPDGTYLHQVDFWMERTGDQRFRGVLKVKGDHLSLVLLSAFDTTLARIQDSVKKSEPQIELHLPELREHEDRIRQAYIGLKPALIDLKVPEIEVFGRTAVVDREGMDASGVPKIIRITDDHFRFVIEVAKP